MKEIEQLTKLTVEQIPDWGLERMRNDDEFTITESEDGLTLVFNEKKEIESCPWCGNKRGECTDCRG